MSNSSEKPTPRRSDLGAGIQAKPNLALPREEAEFTLVEPAALAPATPFEESPLVDRDIFERVSFPFWPVVYLVLALVSCAFIYEGTWVATAILAPIGVSLALVYSYDYFRPTRFRVSADGIACSRPRVWAPFDEFREVVPGTPNKRGEFPIYVVFSRGMLTIPSRLTCASVDLLDLLRGRVPASTELPAAPPLFDAFLKQQELIYPVEQIHVFRGSSKPMRPTATRSLFKFALALLLPLPLWIALAIANPRKEAFAVVAGIFGFFAVLFGLIAFGASFGRSRRVKNADDAVLIITPDGLALSQADLRGELRWSEVQKLRHQSIAGGSFQFQLTAQPVGLSLRVQGAEIVIADIYDWPIEAIIPLVRRYSGL